MEQTEHIWLDGEFVAWPDATVHVLSHALHYGTGVFEGIRAYANGDGTAVFRLDEHMRRLLTSAAAYSMDLPYTADELAAAACETIRVNGLEACYVRPIAFYETGTIGLNPAAARIRVSIAAFPWGAYLGEEGIRNGIRVKIASWARISPRAFPAAKATGPYINSVLANQEAKSAGFDEALLLTEGGNVSEGSGENLFLVKDGAVFTPPLSDGCLDGITRQSIITLLSDAGFDVSERTLSPEAVHGADELFFTGTAAEVTPIREVDETLIGDPGPVTREAQRLFRDAVSGVLGPFRSWLTYV
jgi:branched-chain amino acid aminotransferase